MGTVSWWVIPSLSWLDMCQLPRVISLVVCVT